MLLGTYRDVVFRLQYRGQGLHLAVAPNWREDVTDDRPSRTTSGGGVVFLVCSCICLCICRPRCTDRAALKVRMIANNWRGWEWHRSVAAMCNVTSRQFPEQTERNHKEDPVRVFGAVIEIRTRHRRNTIQKRYCFGQLARFSALTKEVSIPGVVNCCRLHHMYDTGAYPHSQLMSNTTYLPNFM